MGRISNVRRDMDLDISSPDADELVTVSVMRYPGGCHLFTGIRTFPRKLRALKTVRLCFAAGARKTLVTVIEEVTGNLGGGVGEQRQHENFGIPKGMPAVAKTRKRLRADIDAVIMAGRSNQQLEQIETD